jgi:CRP-like cAMP-binding protein
MACGIERPRTERSGFHRGAACFIVTVERGSIAMVNVQRLQKYSLFGGLADEQLARVIPRLERASWKAGEAILREGDANDRVFFILAGRVRVSRGGSTLIEFGEGDAFGEMELIEVMPVAATITALDAVETASISNRSFRALYHEDLPAFALVVMNLARELSRRLRRMDEKATDRTPV